MSSPERAISEGQNLLNRFRSAQGDDGTESSIYSLNEYERPHDKAIAEGSLLASSYSATKRGGLPFSDNISDAVSDDNGALDFGAWDGRATRGTPHKTNEAIEIIGKIMAELGSIERHDEPVVETVHLSERLGKISDMLHSVKSQLARSAVGANTLDFSPYSNGNSSGVDDENSMVKTPGKNDILKNYMRNQLELQESEWESYEEAINSLAEQLEAKTTELEGCEQTIERLTDERDDLASMTTSLGERLQGLGQEKYELLMEREEWNVERQELHSARDLLLTSFAAKDEDIARSTARVNELEEEVNSLRDKCRASERSVHDSRRKVEVLATENIELQKALADLKMEKRDLVEQLEQWELYEKSTSLEMESLRQQLQNVETKFKDEVQRATERSNLLSKQVYDSETASAATIADLREQLKRASEQTEADKATITSLMSKVCAIERNNESGVRELAEALDAAQQYRAQLEEMTSALGARDDAFARLQESLQASDLYVRELESKAQCANEDVTRLKSEVSRATLGATRSSPSPLKNSSGAQMLPPVDSPDEAEVNVLKNYMKNQLELQEAEWENYEETINNLASQLEVSQQQVESLEENIQQLIAERNELLTQVSQTAVSADASATSSMRPPPLNVNVQGDKRSNQPSSVRSWISLDSTVEGSPNKESTYQFDYSMFDDTAIADQVERFKIHVEQQIRVQVSQLQSLQESLSEEKNTTALLQKQKHALKAMISNLNAEVDELKGKIEKYEVSEQNLRNEVSELHVLLSEKEQELTQRAAIVATAATPASAEKKPDYPRTPEVFEYRATISNLEANLSRKAARCDELTVEVSRLRTAFTSKSDELDHHRAQFTKIEAELQATLLEKERTLSVLQDLIARLEEQSRDDANSIQELSGALASEREENLALNDVLNMIKEKDEATESMLKGMSEQRMVMSTRFVEIESRVSTLTTQLHESESKYESTVKLLQQAESERDKSNMRIVEYKSKLNDLDQSSFDKISEFEAQVHRLQRQLSDETDEVERLKKRLVSVNDLTDNYAKNISEEKSRALTAQLKVNELSETVQSLRNQIDRMKRDSEADRREIESLLIAADDRSVAGDESRKNLLAQLSEKDILIAERDGNIKVLQHQANLRCDDIAEMESQIRDLKRKIASGVNDCNVMRTAFKAMATELSYFSTASGEQSEALVARVEGWVSLFGKRLDTVCDQVAFLTEDYRDRENLMEDLKEQLADSRGYSERLEEDRLELEARLAENMVELREVRNRLDLANEDIVQLKNHLDDAERRIYEERAQIDLSKQSFSGDIHRLAERLENAEKRVHETTTANAKLFTDGARGTAFLEGECSRLRGLVDHLRLVNAKLQGDAKAASALAAHGRGFENRLKISIGEGDRLRSRIEELEEELRSKDSAQLEALQEAQDGEWARQRQFDEEIAQMTSEIDALKSEVMESNSNLEGVLASKDSLERSLNAQIEELNLMCQRSDENSAYHEGRAAEVESQASVLRAELRLAEENLAAAKQHHNSKVFSLEEKINEHSQSVASLQKQINASDNCNKSLETDIAILNTKFKASTDELAERDSALARMTSKLEAAMDEIDLLRSNVSTSQSELDALQRSKERDSEAIVSMKAERESLRDRASELDGELHRVTAALSASNNQIKALLAEVEDKEQSITTLEQEAMTKSKCLLDAESRIEDLQQDVSEFRERAQALELDVNEQKTDLAFLKSELDSLAKDCSQKSKENVALYEKLNEANESIAVLKERLSEEEKTRRHGTSLLLELGAAERGIVVTMNSFISANNAAAEKREKELKKAGMKPTDLFEDLLASPPPPRNLIYATPTGDKPPLTEKPDGSKLTFDIETVPYTLGGAHFYGLQASVNALQDFISHYRSRCSGLEAALGAATSRSSDIEIEFKSLQARYSEKNTELSRLNSDLKLMEEELGQLTDLESTNRNDCELLRKNNSSLSNQLRKVKRDIQNLLHSEATSRAQAIVESYGGTANPLLLRASSENYVVSLVDETDIIPYTDDGNSVLLSDLKNTVSSFSSSLETLSRELHNRDRIIKDLENDLTENAVAWEKEKSVLHSRIVLAAEASEEEKLVNNEFRSLLQNVSDELERVKGEAKRSSNVINDLEANLRSKLLELDDLQNSLQLSERLHHEIAEDLRNEKKSAVETMNMLDKSQRDIQNLRQKITALNLTIEEKTSEIDRLLSSNQSLSEVKQTLEIELEQSRRDLELISTKEKNLSRAEDSKAAYEVERLLAALAATVDHMQTSAQANVSFDQSLDFSLHSHNPFAAGGPASGQNLVLRVDQAVKRLSEMRSWAREEKRASRKLVSSNADLERELAALKSSNNERIRILTEDLEKARMREKNHQDSINTISEKESAVVRLQTELSVLQRELVVYRSSKDSDSEIRSAQAKELLAKESEISRLTRECQVCTAEKDNFEAKLYTAEREVANLRAENADIAEQHKKAKSNVSSMKDTIDRLEASVSRYKQEIEALQKRLLLAAANSGPAVETMRHNLENTEKALVAAKEANEAYRRTAEERSSASVAEIEEYRRRILQLENKLDIQLKARSSSSEEVASLRHELLKAQTQRETQSNEWNSSKAKMSALKNSEDEWRLQLNAASSMLESMEERLNMSESECSRLRAQLQTYQDAHASDHRAQLAIEIDARKRLELEAGRISTALERCQRESATISKRASELRAEGRHVRRCVLEIAEQLQEIVSDIRHKNPGDFLNDSNHSATNAPSSLLEAALGLRSISEGAELVQSLEGEDVPATSRAAEGVHELTNALDNIRKMLSWMKSFSTWSSNHDVEGKIRRLETENSRLLREADNFSSLQEDKIRRLQSEIDTLENLLSAARHRESSRIHDLDSRKSEMEQAHERDKEALKKVENELNRTKNRLAEVDAANASLNAEVVKLSAASRQVGECEVLRKQLQASKSELQIMVQRNTSLQETISKLDALSTRDNIDISMSSEYASGLPSMSYLSTTLGSGEFMKTIDPQQSAQIHEGILQLQRHLSKHKLRSKMFEDMSGIFRCAYLSAVSVQVSSTDGSSSWLHTAPPYGKIVEVIRKSYEESMSLLEEQIESCLGVIRQNNSYMTELRTRLEDTLRALYKNGRGDAAPAGSVESSQQQHIDLLSKSLKQVQDKYETCSTALSEERRAGRHRHEALVSELSSIVTSCEQAQEETSKWRDESEILQRRLDGANAEINSLKRTIDSLRHGLIETDTELDTVQRLQRRGDRAGSDSEKARSMSQGHGRMATAIGKASDTHPWHQAYSSKSNQESLHESTAFSVKELSREYGDSSAISSRGPRTSGQGDLSDAVQSALDAAAQLRSENRYRSAGIRGDSEVPTFSHSLGARRRDDSIGIRNSITPPREKRVAVSGTPTSMNLSGGASSRGYGHGATVGHGSSPSGYAPVAHTQQQSFSSSNRLSGGLSTYSTVRESSFGSVAESSTTSGTHTLRRKVKATVRRNY